MNTNCLQGIACPDPACGQDTTFRIYASAWFDVTDDGTGDYTDVEWDGDSAIICGECGYKWKVSRFRAVSTID